MFDPNLDDDGLADGTRPHLAAVSGPEGGAPEPAGPPIAEPEETGVGPELLDALRPYLTESLMVLDADWTILANLAPPGGLIGRGLGLGLHTLEDMHPDDAVRVLDLGMQAFSTQPGWQGSRIVRMKTGAGSYGRYEIAAINRFDDPVIGGMVVRTRELPEQVIEEWAGEQPTSAIETLAELLPIGVLVLDGKGRVVFANGSACGMLGREPEAIKRDGLDVLFAEDDRPLIDGILGRVTQTPSRESCSVELVGASVERAACTFTSEGDDEVTCVVVTLEDVTEREAEHRDLEQRANHDHLTGLRNRASLDAALQERLDRRHPTMAAYLDLDGFKAVNDTWGHERGDQLLVSIADRLRTAMPPGTELARIGGDEFVAVGAPDPDLAARMCSVVDQVARDEGLAVGCSVGVAEAGDGDTAHDVLRRADRAMYDEKATRRR